MAAYASPVTRILLRPFRLETWRELAFLLAGGITAVIGFCVQVAGLSAGLSLLITLVGIPILLALAYVDRWVCAVDRWRTSLLLREPVPGVYRKPERRGFLALLRTVGSDPQTWRDVAWIWLNAVLGFASAVLMLSLWASVGWLLTLPFYWWLLPESAQPDGPFGKVDTWAEVLGGAGLGVVLAPLTAWIGAGLAVLQARMARRILGPSERERLEHRVGELARTRAAAVDAQASELRRIERDLHDGAQARMVAVTMDLGRAREKLDSDPGAARELGRGRPRGGADGDRRSPTARRGHRARGADRPRARCGALGARRVLPCARLARRPAGRASAHCGRGRRVLRRLRGARQCSEARRRAARARPHAAPGREPDRRDRGRRERGASLEGGTGLAGLRDRVAALDGTLVVTSPDGGPTIVRAEIPCAS